MPEPTAATTHRLVAGAFGDLVRSADPASWDQQSPVPDWKARDVVDHLVTWFPDFLEAGSGIVLPAGPSATIDPVGAWEHQYAAIADLLDDPATPNRMLTNPHIGEVPLDQAIDRFYTGDVFQHTWDLACATGQPADLDPERCAEMLAGMEPMDEMLRASGQYGPKVDVPAGASAQDRLIGFLGRDPAAWA